MSKTSAAGRDRGPGFDDPMRSLVAPPPARPQLAKLIGHVEEIGAAIAEIALLEPNDFGASQREYLDRPDVLRHLERIRMTNMALRRELELQMDAQADAHDSPPGGHGCEAR